MEVYKMRIWNGAIKIIKTLLTINERFDYVEKEITELRNDVGKIQERIDDVYKIIVETLLKRE